MKKCYESPAVLTVAEPVDKNAWVTCITACTWAD